MKDLVKFLIRVGGLFFGIRNRIFIGCMLEFGGFFLVSLIVVIFKDYMLV